MPLRPLTPIEARVLGTLMEKARTVPDSYPLSLNSLMLGCNQKTSREPFMELVESDVAGAIDVLKALALADRIDDQHDVAEPRETLREMGELGFFSLRVPEALLRRNREGPPLTLADILFRSATLTSESGIKARAARADLYLRMPVSGIGLFDWKRIDEIIDRGYRQAQKSLEAFVTRDKG